MNILFHTTTAIGIAVLLTNIRKIRDARTNKLIIGIGIAAFTIGIIAHGMLDYLPHCYPVNSKVDAIAGLTMIIVFTWLTLSPYRLITVLSFLGCIFPDLIDLLPAIVNKQLNLDLPVFDKVFPWHWPAYSGSIYGGDCTISTLNHLLVVASVCAICWCRRTALRKMASF